MNNSKLRKKIIYDKSGEFYVLSNDNVSESKTFDVSSIKGFDKAEAYQELLMKKYFKVRSEPVGVNKIRISGIRR